MSQMGSFAVRPEQVTALSSQIRSGANGMRSELENLDSKVAALRASWSGQAQESYDVAQRSWTKSLTELQQLLDQIATKTEQISQEYSAMDTNSSGRFSRS